MARLQSGLPHGSGHAALVRRRDLGAAADRAIRVVALVPSLHRRELRDRRQRIRLRARNGIRAIAYRVADPLGHSKRRQP